MIQLETRARIGSSDSMVIGHSQSWTAESAIDAQTLAAIGLALDLELELQSEASRVAVNRGTSFWALAGRARALRGG
jgi:hypothetical protein